MLIDVFGALVVAASAFIGLSFFRVAIITLRGDRVEYNRNRHRVRSTLNVIKGEVPTKFDGTRDDRVAAGVVADLRTGRWREQGRLSEEALRDAASR